MAVDGSVIQSFKGKSILVTGATGFLAKIFVEKVLRIQPQVKKLYLLLRATSSESAAQRLQEDVIGKLLFNVLREKHGDDFDRFVSEKISPVVGDITEENLGIEDSTVRERLWNEVHIVVNVAATTDFFERYDVALRTNVLGAKHALQFAKKCLNIQLLLHVSTAYVAGTQEGLILEKNFKMGETLNGNSVLDIDEEMKLMEETLRGLKVKEVTKNEEKDAMKQLGLDRAKAFGWPNTYVFTKAMAEMLLGHQRESLPLVIIRPTIITSIYNDPIPGWMEGIRTIDSFIVGYGKGKLSHFLVDIDLIMGAIPGDMVSNAMIVAITAHSNQPLQQIYHVGSSVRNPVKYSNLSHCVSRFFKENPQVGKDGKIIKPQKIRYFPTISSLHSYMNLRYKLPLEGFKVANVLLCNTLFSQKYQNLRRKFNFVMRIAEIYGPFSLFKGRFDDANLERLRTWNKGESSEEKMLAFDPKIIDWNHYLHDIHVPGVMKYACK